MYICIAMHNCRQFDRQAVFREALRALRNDGSRIETSNAIIPITTSSSTSVKPRRLPARDPRGREHMTCSSGGGDSGDREAGGPAFADPPRTIRTATLVLFVQTFLQPRTTFVNKIS